MVDENNEIIKIGHRCQQFRIQVIFDNLTDINRAFLIKKESFELIIKKFIEKF